MSDNTVDYLSELRSSYRTATNERKPSNELDKDAFLKLLLAQMQYQDPLNPTDDKEFIAQLAQFSSLEQMQNLSSSFSNQQAYSLIGKSIYAITYNETTMQSEEVSGVVTSVRVKNGESYVMVGDKQVSLSNISKVGSDGYLESISGLNQNVITQQNLSLMGKYIQAIIADAEGNPTSYIEGKVDYVKFDGYGNAVLVVGTEEIFAREVFSIAEIGETKLIGRKIDYETTDANGDKVIITNGIVEEVRFRDNEAYLVIGGKEVLVKNMKIGLVTDALNCVGKEISYQGTTGAVESIVVKNGVPCLVVDGIHIPYTDFKDIKME